MARDRVAKAVCFQCRYVDVGAKLGSRTRCPHCSYPLILNTASVALATDELEGMFRLQRITRSRFDLPGIASPRKRRTTRRIEPLVEQTQPVALQRAVGIGGAISASPITDLSEPIMVDSRRRKEGAIRVAQGTELHPGGRVAAPLAVGSRRIIVTRPPRTRRLFGV